MFPRFVRKSFLTTSLCFPSRSSDGARREGRGKRWITAGIQPGLGPILLCNPISTGTTCHWKCQGYFWNRASRGNVENFGISAAFSGSGRREKLGMVWRGLGDSSSFVPCLRNPKSCSFLAFCSPWVIHIWGFSRRNLPAGLQSKQWQHPRISAAPAPGTASSWN